MQTSILKKLFGKPEPQVQQEWLDYVREHHPRHQSKPKIEGFPVDQVTNHPMRKLGGRSRYLRKSSGFFLPAPDPGSREQYIIQEFPGETNKPNPPTTLLDQELHDGFGYFLPSFSSRRSCVLELPNGSFHGHDHTLFDKDFKLIDWEPPYWALDCGLPPSMLRGRLPSSLELKGKVFVLSAPGAKNNYWHLLFDLLPKVKLIRDVGMELSGFDHVVVNSASTPLERDVLGRLGIAPDRIVESEKFPLIKAQAMTYVSMGCLLPPDPWVLQWLGETFIPSQDAPFPGRRLFVSRASAKHRKFLNENVLWSRLQEYGFEKVSFENLSIDEQIRVTREASAIVAPHGAGLTNLVWCRPGTKVVEYFAPEYVNVCYWNIANMLNLDYACACGDLTLESAALSRPAIMELDRLGADISFPDVRKLADATLEFINQS